MSCLSWDFFMLDILLHCMMCCKLQLGNTVWPRTKINDKNNLFLGGGIHYLSTIVNTYVEFLFNQAFYPHGKTR